MKNMVSVTKELVKSHSAALSLSKRWVTNKMFVIQCKRSSKEMEESELWIQIQIWILPSIRKLHMKNGLEKINEQALRNKNC